jgi:hypothetical protein
VEIENDAEKMINKMRSRKPMR